VFEPVTPAARADLQRRHGLDPARPVVGYLGRLHWEKGLAVLLAAVAGLPGVQLLLVGDGPHRAEIIARAAELGLLDRTRFVGAVPRPDTPGYLNAMDCLVVPSLTTRRWKEQFGRIITEAALCALPVVGSSSGAIPEVVGPGGVIVAEGDVPALAGALAALLADPAQRRALGAAGRARALGTFTWSQVARQRLALYRDALRDA
jgi:glycosyltransferase involved in cell wall biosynthesis